MFIALICGLFLISFTSCYALILCHFSASNPWSPSFFYLSFLQVIQRQATYSGFSSAVSSFTPRNFTNFCPLTVKGAICWRPVIHLLRQLQDRALEIKIPPNFVSMLDKPKNRSRSLPSNVRDSSGQQKFHYGSALEQRFEFLNSPNSIQSVKGAIQSTISPLCSSLLRCKS